MIVVAHFQPFRAVTLVGGLVNDVAILTIALSSNLVQPGTRRAVGRGRWSGCVSRILGCVNGVRGCLGSMGGRLGSVGGCLIGALVKVRTIPQILSIRTAALQVSFSEVVSHFQTLGAVTLVGFSVNHVAILTVTFSSNMVQCSASWAVVRRGIGCGSVCGCLGSVGGRLGSVGGCLGSVGGRLGSVGGRLGSMGGCLGSVGGCLGSVGGRLGSVGGCLIGALVEMKTIPQILSIRTAALQVSFSEVVSHFQPLGAITLVGFPVNHVAILTVTFSSNMVQCGASWAVVRRGIGCGSVCGCLCSVGGCLGSMGGCLGSVGGRLGSVGGCLIGAFVEMKTIPQILSIRTAALQVSFSEVVSHFQPLGAVTLVGFSVNHVAILTVTFSSNMVQCGASWAVVRRGIGCGNRVLQQE